MAIKPKLQSLLASANEVTGEERTNLTDAMQDLVDGYGQGDDNPLMSYGASSSGISKLQVAENMWLQTPENYAQFKMLTAENTNFIFNPASANESLRVIVRAKPTVVNSGYPYVKGTSSWQMGVCCDIRNDGGVAFFFTDNSGSTKSVSAPANFITANVWYYFCIGYDVASKFFYGAIYDDSGTLIWVKCLTVSGAYNNTLYYQKLGGECYNDNCFRGYIDIKSTLFEIDGVPVWGTETLLMKHMGNFDFSSPNQFTKVDYLIADGTQYINTGINPSNSLRLKMKCMRGTVGTEVYHMFGGRPSGGGNGMYTIYLSTDMKFRSDYGSTWGNLTDYTDTGDYITIDKDGRTTTFNNVTVTAPSETFSSNFPVYLFSWNNGGAIPKSTCERMIIDCEMYQGGVLSRNYIPVYHNVTGIRGMFDSANNKFYYNNGTGDFGIPSDTSGEINLAEYLASLT